MDTNKQWNQWLCSDSVDHQVNALRQISGQKDVRGLTAIIVGLSGSRSDEVRIWSAEALETAVQPQQDDVHALADLLSDAEDGEIGYWAATMLGRLGDQATDAVDALEKCVSQSMYLPARERATWALCQIGPAAQSAAATLREAAADAPPRLQRMATEALRAIGEAA